jgi:hypothetical protein
MEFSWPSIESIGIDLIRGNTLFSTGGPVKLLPVQYRLQIKIVRYQHKNRELRFAQIEGLCAAVFYAAT